jgi:hypothetical protein
MPEAAEEAVFCCRQVDSKLDLKDSWLLRVLISFINGDNRSTGARNFATRQQEQMRRTSSNAADFTVVGAVTKFERRFRALP